MNHLTFAFYKKIPPRTTHNYWADHQPSCIKRQPTFVFLCTIRKVAPYLKHCEIFIMTLRIQSHSDTGFPASTASPLLWRPKLWWWCGDVGNWKSGSIEADSVDSSGDCAKCNPELPFTIWSLRKQLGPKPFCSHKNHAANLSPSGDVWNGIIWPSFFLLLPFFLKN